MKCKKCGYVRQKSDNMIPAYKCPKCDAVYSKVEIHDRWKRESRIAKTIMEEQGALVGQYACTACGHVGKGYNATRGHPLIAIVLLAFFLIPGIVYMIWMISTRHKRCTVCHSDRMIPAQSPLGRRIVRNGPYAIEARAEQFL